jgi:hypothetical protein
LVALFTTHFGSALLEGKDLDVTVYPDGPVMRTPMQADQAEFFGIIADDEDLATWKLVHIKHHAECPFNFYNRFEFRFHMIQMRPVGLKRFVA